MADPVIFEKGGFNFFLPFFFCFLMGKGRIFQNTLRAHFNSVWISSNTSLEITNERGSSPRKILRTRKRVQNCAILMGIMYNNFYSCHKRVYTFHLLVMYNFIADIWKARYTCMNTLIQFGLIKQFLEIYVDKVSKIPGKWSELGIQQKQLRRTKNFEKKIAIF